MGDTLTLEIFEQARRYMVAGSLAPAPVGLSMSPALHAQWVRYLVVQGLGGIRLPVLIDPRMTGNPNATVFYDKKIWRKRVKNQNKWDRQQRRHFRQKEQN